MPAYQSRESSFNYAWHDPTKHWYPALVQEMGSGTSVRELAEHVKRLSVSVSAGKGITWAVCILAKELVAPKESGNGRASASATSNRPLKPSSANVALLGVIE